MPQTILVQYQIKAEPPPSAITGDIPGRLESARHFPWSEPVRVSISPRLAVALGASGGLWAPSLTFPSIFFESNRHFPWAEPVRLKPGLRPHLDPFYFAEPFSLSVPESVTESRWHYAWSEPIRFTFKPKMRPGEFPSFFAPPRLLPNPNVTAVMAATETNSDVAIFDINVYTSATPTTSLSGANVSVVEISQEIGPVSVREGQ